MSDIPFKFKPGSGTFYDVFYFSPIIMVITTLDEGIIVDANAEFFSQLGMEREEVIGKTTAELKLWTKPEQRDGVVSVIKQCRRVRNVEVDFRSKTGEVRSCLYTAERIQLDDKPFLLSSVIDITDRRNSEEKLRISEEVFYKTFHNCPIAITLSDMETRKFVEVNQGFIKISGYTAQEAIGREPDELGLWIDPETPFKIIREFRKNKRVEGMELEIRTKSGKIVSLLWAGEILKIFGKEHMLATCQDISAWKQSEEQRRISEEKFRKTFHNCPIGITLTDLKTMKFIEINQGFTGITGYSEEETIGHTVIELGLWSPEMESRVLNIMKTDGFVHELELDIQTKAGSVITIIWSGETIDVGGRACILVTFKDISAHKKDEEKLRVSEEKFQNIFQSSPVGISLSEMSTGRFLEVNQAFQTITGFSAAEANGHTSFEVGMWVNTDDRDDFVSKLKQEGCIRNFELPIRQKSGNIISVLWGADKIKINNLDFLLVSGLDITVLKKNEERRRISEDKFSRIFNASPTIITLSSLENGTFIDVNAEFLRLFEYDKTEILNKSALTMTIWYDLNDRNRIVTMLKQNERFRNQEVKFFTKSGRVLTFLFSAEKVIVDGKECLLALGNEISELKAIENDNKLLEERLARAEKMELLGLLAGGVAHDLNNILSAVIGYPEILLSMVEPGHRMVKPLTAIRDSGERAAAVVQDLLTLTRRGVADKKIINLNNLIKEYLISPEHCFLSSHFPDITVSMELADELLNISGSSHHLIKSISNLLINAAEAMPAGGKISIMTENRFLDRNISGYMNVLKGEYAILSVSDEGTGIDSADLKKIFEPFYTKKSMGSSGTGLGLTVVWGTIQDHQGYIDVKSNKRGTSFELFFPASRDKIVIDSQQISELGGNGELILVVDDMPEQRELAMELLKSLGYNVSLAASGKSAVDFLQKEKADLVLIDMIMDPGWDGLDTFREIKKIVPLQKAVVMSGFSKTESVTETLNLGANTYLKKPFSLKSLALAVKKALES
ncbi:MAG: PAS domain S-box protein [Candidatus Wallbacteria bacterium]|nr:PAS domain S-box protein [Candidatus Wallbacteria bacterium]